MTAEHIIHIIVYALTLWPIVTWLSLRIYYRLDRVPKKLQRREIGWLAGPERPEPPRKLSPELREELDQTPRWWDKQFHKLLVETNQHYLEYGEVVYVEDFTFARGSVVHTLPRPRAYTGCTCSDCASTRLMGCDPRD